MFFISILYFFVVFWHWFNRNNRKSRDLSFGDTHFGFRRYKESRKMQMKRNDNGKLVLFVCLTLWVYWPYLCVRCALLRRAKRTFWQRLYMRSISRLGHDLYLTHTVLVCSLVRLLVVMLWITIRIYKIKTMKKRKDIAKKNERTNERRNKQTCKCWMKGNSFKYKY